MTFVMLTMCVATFLTRWLMLHIPEKYLTRRIRRGLLYVPIGILIALIIPYVCIDDTTYVLRPYVLIAIIAGFFCYRWTRQFLTSFLVVVLLSCISSFFIMMLLPYEDALVFIV